MQHEIIDMIYLQLTGIEATTSLLLLTILQAIFFFKLFDWHKVTYSLQGLTSIEATPPLL